MFKKGERPLEEVGKLVQIQERTTPRSLSHTLGYGAGGSRASPKAGWGALAGRTGERQVR